MPPSIKGGMNMKRSIRSIFVVAAALLMISGLGTTASATNGYFSHAYSPYSKAMAGAGTALPLDSLAASTNPAGMVFVGQRVDAGISFFNPNREYKVSSAKGTGSPIPFPLQPGTVESDSKWFIIPSLGVNVMMNNDYSLGLSIYGNGGMNTDYDKGTYNYSSSALPQETGVDLMQLFVVPTYARKINQKHAFGISPIFAYQAFEIKGVEAFGGFSNNRQKLSGNGHENSYGIGGRIGYLGEIMPNLFFGASYQTRIYMSEFDDYAGLFAEDGDFDIPSNWSVGLAYMATESLTLAVDVQQIYYSEVDAIGNRFNPGFTTCALTSSSNSSCLGGDRGFGFGWEDMTVVKVGVQWQSSSQWTWRAGYSYGEQPAARCSSTSSPPA
jgi:long-chain fatty acid transport protein